MDKKTRTNVFWVGAIFLMIISIWFFQEILVPSYYSYRVDCYGVDEVPEGYSLAGFVNLTENQSITIIVGREDPQYLATLKHEECHIKQAQSGRLGNCRKPLSVIFLEIECYIKERI